MLAYDDTLCRVSTYSKTDKIPNGNEAGASEATRLERYDILFTEEPLRAVITDEYGNKAIYDFNSDRTISAYYEEVNGLVSKAERYEYQEFSYKKTISAPRAILHKSSFDAFFFEEGETSLTQLNAYNLPTTKTVTNIQVTPTVTKTVETSYEYDGYLRCVKEITTETYSNGSSYVFVTKNTYNENTGALTKTISYVQGEEASTGITAQEYEYDQYGNVQKTKTYKKICSTNNPTEESEYEFDSSVATDIFFEYKTYNAQKQLTSEFDQAGNKTEYEYLTGTKLVSRVTKPNNGATAYVYDVEDRAVAAVWAAPPATANKNFIVYDSGEVVELNYSETQEYLHY